VTKRPPFKDWPAMPQSWVIHHEKVNNYASANADAGTTANRPTSGLWIGRPYFDTTLGYRIHVKTVNPTPVWVRYDGAVV
jgi:hypothetical protein